LKKVGEFSYLAFRRTTAGESALTLIKLAYEKTPDWGEVRGEGGGSE